MVQLKLNRRFKQRLIPRGFLRRETPKIWCFPGAWCLELGTFSNIAPHLYAVAFSSGGGKFAALIYPMNVLAKARALFTPDSRGPAFNHFTDYCLAKAGGISNNFVVPHAIWPTRATARINLPSNLFGLGPAPVAAAAVVAALRFRYRVFWLPGGR